MAYKNTLTPLSARPPDLHLAVRAQRERLHKSRRQLAEDANVSLRTVQRLERGDAVSADAILRVERALELAPATLVPAWRTGDAALSGAIGPRLREQRRAMRLTLTQLAEYSGMSAATLSRLERGLLGNIDSHDDRIGQAMIDNLNFKNRAHFDAWVEGRIPSPRPREHA